MTAKDLAICVPNPSSQNTHFFKVAWDLPQTEGTGSEWKSKYPEQVSGPLSLEPVGIHGPDKLYFIPCVL